LDLVVVAVDAVRRTLHQAPALEVSKVEGHDRFKTIGKKMARDGQKERYLTIKNGPC
jgi:hypothetical protein